MLSPRDAWLATLGQLQIQLNRATFDTWLKGSELLDYADGTFTIQVRHAYAKDWLEAHLHHLITHTLSGIYGRASTIQFVVHNPRRTQMQADPGTLWAKAPDAIKTANANGSKPTGANRLALLRRALNEIDAEDSANEALKNGGSAPIDPDRWDPRISNVSHDKPGEKADRTPLAEQSLNPLYTFDSFVAGPSNEFAYAAAKAVAESTTRVYNPLVVYGGVGLGKTHLLQAIGHACRTAGKRVIYVTAESFTNDMVRSIRGRQMDAFREHYRSADVLLVDDIQFMVGKSSTEEEFYHTFNALHDQNKQVVIACNQHPRTLSALDERLRSRMEGGLLTDIQPPQIETRLQILKVKSAAQGKELPQEVLDVLARYETSNVRELEGLMNQVIARATLTRQPLTANLAHDVIAKNNPDQMPPASTSPRSSKPANRKTDLNAVLEATATYHQLSMDDLISKRRTKAVVRARHIAIYLAREETEASLPAIGEALGGRNHSTVLHGYQKIADEVAADESLRREVSAIRQRLYLANN